MIYIALICMLFAYTNFNKFKKYKRLQFRDSHEAIDNAEKVMSYKVNFLILSVVALGIILYLTFNYI